MLINFIVSPCFLLKTWTYYGLNMDLPWTQNKKYHNNQQHGVLFKVLLLQGVENRLPVPDMGGISNLSFRLKMSF